MAAPLLDLLPGAIDLCGALSLPEVAACFKRCALFVGNDSGLMHLAAAAGTPTLGLFGPTPWAEYAPSGRCAGFVCSPTQRMEDLPVADALAAAVALVGRSQAARRTLYLNVVYILIHSGKISGVSEKNVSI